MAWYQLDDIDKVFEKWGQSVDKLYGENGNEQKLTDAELNYESVLAKKISECSIASTAKDISRGDKEVIEKKKEMLEAKRCVNGGKAKIEYLKELEQWLKAKWKKENEIVK